MQLNIVRVLFLKKRLPDRAYWSQGEVETWATPHSYLEHLIEPLVTRPDLKSSHFCSTLPHFLIIGPKVEKERSEQGSESSSIHYRTVLSQASLGTSIGNCIIITLLWCITVQPYKNSQYFIHCARYCVQYLMWLIESNDEFSYDVIMINDSLESDSKEGSNNSLKGKGMNMLTLNPGRPYLYIPLGFEY